MNAQEEAMQIWKYLEPMVERKIRNAMASAVRRKNFEVAAAPNGTTIGVREPGSSKVINIPYVAALENVTVGSTVQCEWTYNMTNLIATAHGNGL